MSSAVEKILAEIHDLTPAEQEELRTLWPQAQSIRPTPELVDQIKGKYSLVATSSDAFAAQKRQDIELEERRFRKS